MSRTVGTPGEVRTSQVVRGGAGLGSEADFWAAVCRVSFRKIWAARVLVRQRAPATKEARA